MVLRKLQAGQQTGSKLGRDSKKGKGKAVEEEEAGGGGQQEGRKGG
jgi:hypothetical protein